MSELPYWVAVAVIWGMALCTFRNLVRNRRSPQRLVNGVYLAALSLGVVAMSQRVRPVIDRVADVPGLGRWLAFSLLTVATCAYWILVTYVTGRPGAPPPRIRARVTTAGVVIVVMGVSLLGDGSLDDSHFHFIAMYGNRPGIAGFFLAYLAYDAAMLIDMLRLGRRCVGHTRQPYLRLGMRLLVLGNFCGLAYVAYAVVTVLIRFWSLPMPPGSGSAAPSLLGVVAVALILAGSTISGWGPWATRPWRTAAQLWTLARLRPLWRALTAQMPELKRQQPALHNVEHRLYRRIIEIRDGLVFLERYADPRLRQQSAHAIEAGGRTSAAAEAAIQARLIATALRSRATAAGADGVLPEHTGEDLPATTTGAVLTEDIATVPTAPLLRNEVTYLTTLSRAFARLGRASAAERRERPGPSPR
ncbi:MAB_1171c family putative transporter [Actinoallomurus rhizosphaericola]|uniref:MAB_1171c family putative transporter n=1 Tax=Actinoallomurus rhizosphaericola TaxID=2952536 RepID=UPI002093E39D|nr:MAB_1171c family putative transporter [Actinoallomurus rhizosphaericola]MCO5995864.1 hypothetical protein [Actinoallomurus rhizosphaericola]